MPISIFATIFPRPEHRDAVEQALRAMVERSRAEPGNLRYDLFLREGDELAFDLFELYVDAPAIEAHRSSTHYQAYRATIADWLAAPTQVRVAHPLDIAPIA
ncbi:MULTISPECIES: putative quinol monooxygenase [Pseudomonas]|uniref:Putative monooxygenase n=1 Tax=Pseudomonas putida TaxID=303 RepID=A0A1B2F3I8_PSEPU|nr:MULTISPECIES: putative quinol monooxygenase [Pseudomonas]ANY86798.1 Putative monooxygenase [Pseudomonas putida]MCL8307937.1 antibiotic biosynthesis monooxygenase [Pseudomonas putida]